jgi:hypothetical protein
LTLSMDQLQIQLTMMAMAVSKFPRGYKWRVLELSSVIVAQ